jgi:hypothetical protein
VRPTVPLRRAVPGGGGSGLRGPVPRRRGLLVGPGAPSPGGGRRGGGTGGCLPRRRGLLQDPVEGGGQVRQGRSFRRRGGDGRRCPPNHLGRFRAASGQGEEAEAAPPRGPLSPRGVRAGGGAGLTEFLAFLPARRMSADSATTLNGAGCAPRAGLRLLFALQIRCPFAPKHTPPPPPPPTHLLGTTPPAPGPQGFER